MLEFSDRFSRRLYGHESVEEYYTSGSSYHYIIDEMKTPLLCINALDDPLVPLSSIPTQKLMQHPKVIFMTTKYVLYLYLFMI